MPRNGEADALAVRAVSFAREMPFESVPAEVVAAAKQHFLDAIGVGLAAASLPGAGPLAEAVASLGGGGASTALGLATPLPAPSAALLNGTHIHSLEYDDTHMAAIVHGSAVVAPAALAVAEQAAASGRELLRAYIAGWEVFARLGLAAPGKFQARGFQITAVGGPFIAALVAAQLARLSPAQTVAAIGIAGSQSSGVFEYLSEGATVKSLHPGWAAHGGLVAAALAGGGMTGPSTILDGRFGFYRTFAGDADAPAALAVLFDGLGAEWQLPAVALKAYPCCHYIHPFLECVETLVAAGLRPAEVAEVHCQVPPEEAPIVCDPWPRKQRPSSGYDAKFSLPYCIAAQLVDGALDVDTFAGEPRDAVLELSRRMSWSPLEGTDFPERFAARISVKTAGGTLEAAVDDVRGGPARPLAAADTEAKFRANAGRVLAPAAVNQILELVAALETLDDLGSLSAALRAIA